MNKRKNMSESYEDQPRVNSTHSRYIYDILVELADQINFNHPLLRYKSMRSRSLGSVQALLVEMALDNEEIRTKLRKFMVNEGRNWTYISNYLHKY